MGCRALAGAGTPQDPTKAAACRQHGDNLGRLAHRCHGDVRMGCRALAGAGTPQGSAKTAIRHQHGDDLGQLARRCCERASVRSKGGIPSRHVARAENRPRSGEAVQAARQDFAGSASPAEAALISEYASPEGAPAAPLSLRKRRLLRNATDSGSRFFVRFPCGSGGYCATRRTAGRGSSSAFPAEAAVTAQRDGTAGRGSSSAFPAEAAVTAQRDG